MRGPDPSGRGNAENECLVRLRSPSRRRPRRSGRWRRPVEPEPLEQGPQALATGVHPHDPPPAAAARALKDVKGEDPAQQRRPRRTLTRRPPRPWRRLSHRPHPLASPRRRRSFIDSIVALRNDRRPPPRARAEHPMKAQRMKARGEESGSKSSRSAPADPAAGAWRRRPADATAQTRAARASSPSIAPAPAAGARDSGTAAGPGLGRGDDHAGPPAGQGGGRLTGQHQKK